MTRHLDEVCRRAVLLGDPVEDLADGSLPWAGTDDSRGVLVNPVSSNAIKWQLIVRFMRP